VFANILLADEINRTTPRAQSALLEAMAEGCVTVDGTTHKLPPPFLVIATQNPIDHEGTFPLPEAQLDRFFMKFTLGYPSMEEELKMLQMLENEHPIQSLKPVVTIDELLEAQRMVHKVYVDPKVRQYILQIVHETRAHGDLALGAGPRSTIALFRAAQAMAAIRNRDFVQPDDIKRILQPVMSHRLILRPEARLRKMTSDRILEEIVAEIAVPTLEENGR
jgi:MoxR-like ATPase